MTNVEVAAVRERLQDVAPQELKLVLIFGSAVRGTATDRSDIDVAVLCDGVADRDRLFILLAPVFRSDRLDLVDLGRAGPMLAFRVAREGVPVFARTPTILHEFQSLASRRYADTAKLRRAQQRALSVFLDQDSRA